MTRCAQSNEKEVSYREVMDRGAKPDCLKERGAPGGAADFGSNAG